MSLIVSAAMKVAVPAAMSGLALWRMRRAGDPQRFGLVAPPPRLSVAFVAIYLLWMLASDAAIGWRGPWDFTPWLEAPLFVSIARVLGVALLGPLAEELIFRGFLFGILRDRIGLPATIAGTAIGWAVLHFSYGWAVIAVIVVDGLLLGVARWRTGSVWPPVAMHMFYNLYAIW
jgi:membrane protease YdiL (CAAX protease family)